MSDFWCIWCWLWWNCDGWPPEKEKILVGWPEKNFRSPGTISALSSSSCTSFAFDSSISICLKLASFDLLLPNVSLAFPYPKLYFFYQLWSLSSNFQLFSHWSVLAIPFPTSILPLSGVCLSTSIYHRSFHLFGEVGWDITLTDITFWIWGRPSTLLPVGKSPCTFIMFKIGGLQVIYFLGRNSCSTHLSFCCYFSITV